MKKVTINGQPYEMQKGGRPHESGQIAHHDDCADRWYIQPAGQRDIDTRGMGHYSQKDAIESVKFAHAARD